MIIDDLSKYALNVTSASNAPGYPNQVNFYPSIKDWAVLNDDPRLTELVDLAKTTQIEFDLKAWPVFAFLFFKEGIAYGFITILESETNLDYYSPEWAQDLATELGVFVKWQTLKYGEWTYAEPLVENEEV